MATGQQVVLKRREFDHYLNGYSGVEVHSVLKDAGNPRNGCHISSKAWNVVSLQDCYGRNEEKEPGELSSESNLENEYASALQVNDDDVEVQFPPEKRRKISTVWDGEKKEVKISSKNRIVSLTDLKSSLHSVASFCGEEADVGPQCLNTAEEFYGLDVADPASDGYCGDLERESQYVEQDRGCMGEEILQTFDVMMSRWASDSDTPRSEYNEDMHQEKSSSHESGEFRAFNNACSSVSGEESTCQRPCSEGDGSLNELFLSDEIVGDDDCSSGVDVAHFDVKGKSPSVHRNINMLQSCRSVFEFEKLNKINEGTYGVVYKAKDKKTGNLVALKKVKMDVDDRDGFPMSSLREINILLSLNHPCIVDVKEVVMDGLDSVFLVMEYMEFDLKGILERRKHPFSVGEIKYLMLQLLNGVKFLHDNWVLHRDLKTSNLLLNKEGDLKICDLGLSRQYGTPLKPYTSLVVTLWYRAPELLLNSKQYSTAIDMWSVGCILAELISNEPLFTGKTEIDQLNKIYRILGTPDEKNWPGFSKLSGLKGTFVKHHHNSLRDKFPATTCTGAPTLSDLGLDLLSKLLTYDPEKRITAEAAFNHDWFHEAPLPKYGSNS